MKQTSLSYERDDDNLPEKKKGCPSTQDIGAQWREVEQQIVLNTILRLS